MDSKRPDQNVFLHSLSKNFICPLTESLATEESITVIDTCAWKILLSFA